MFSFDCRGGRAGGQDFIRGVTLWSHLANVGDSKSLIIHPASTTHRQLNDDELRAAGVGPGTIRLSVGTESVDDLIWDLEQGFARTAASAAARGWRRYDRAGASSKLGAFDLMVIRIVDTSSAWSTTRGRSAIVGCLKRAASELLRWVLPQAPRYRVVPVNPREKEILGEKSFKSLLDVPGPVTS